jgi:hypothetical protein
MDWKPKPRILADPAETEPAKPSKLGYVGSEGATSAESPEIEQEPEPAKLAGASAGAAAAGVQYLALNDAGEDSKAIPWAEWKADTLNRLFQEQGLTGRTGRITAATIRRAGTLATQPAGRRNKRQGGNRHG